MEEDQPEFIPKKPRRETAEPQGEISTFVAGKLSPMIRLPESVVFPDKSSGEGSSRVRDRSAVTVKFEDGVVYRLYFKGLVRKETTSAVAGIGAAICDRADNLLFQADDGVNRKGAEIRALILGLSEAVRLGIKRVAIYCDYYPIYQFVLRRWTPKQKKIILLLEDMQRLRQQLTFSKLILVAQKDIKFAFELAREAIVSHGGPPMDTSLLKAAPKGSCLACLDDGSAESLFCVNECLHLYCFKCVKQHVEMRLLQGMEPKCPHFDCKSELTIHSCGKLLTPELIEVWKQRIKEEVVQVTEENCLVECRGLFCEVPWHCGLTYSAYKKLHPDHPVVDVKLKSLADIHRWRLCVKCAHMVEMSQGCYHMTCRCGYEFCYKCGTEWKKNQQSCSSSCPLFEECDKDDEEEEEEEEEEIEEEVEDEEDDEEDDDDDDYFDDPLGDRWSSYEEYLEYYAQMTLWYGDGKDEVQERQHCLGTIYIMDDSCNDGYDDISWDYVCQCGGLSDSDDDFTGVYMDYYTL